jgi:Bacterial Ig domain/FG-GAP-like repeat/PKD domain
MGAHARSVGLLMALVLLVAVAAAAGPAVYIVTLDDQGNSYYLESTGDGTFTTTTQNFIGHIPTQWNYGAGIGKFTNDEYYDFVLGTGSTEPPSPKEIYSYKLTNNGNDFKGPDLAGTWSAGDFSGDFAVAPFYGKVFEGSGLDDLVMVRSGTQDAGLYQNNGDGGFVPSGGSDITGAAPLYSFGADAADINHDGYADFVAAGATGDPRIYVNLGNGDGTFETLTPIDTAYKTPVYGIAAADFDGDYKVDLIATSSVPGVSQNGLEFYKGDGSGGFTADVTGRFGPTDLITANSAVDNYDLNGDGYQDLVVSNLYNYPDAVIVGINDGIVDGSGLPQFTWSDPIRGLTGTRFTIAAPPVFPNGLPGASVSVSAEPPAVLFDGNRIIAGTPLTFSSADSYDPEEMPLEYSWEFKEFKDDGTVTTTTITEQDTVYTFTEPETCDVTLTVTDNYGETAKQMVTIHVNHPPVANDDAYTTDVNTPLIVNAASGVLTNDKDADEDDTLTATLVTDPTQGTLALNTEDGSFTYTPDKDFTGTDSFKYKANDGVDDSNVATVTITVNAHPEWKVNIVPDMINLNSRGVFIAFITLPKPYNVDDVQKDTVVCEGAKAIRINGVPALRMIRHTKFPQTFGAVFKTADLQNVKVGNKVTLTVTGQVEFNGNPVDFSGSDTIRVFTLKNRNRDDTEDFERMSDKQLFEKFPGYRGDGQDRDNSGRDDRDQGNDHH